MISFVDGNILETDCNIICQSVNHKGVMGSGLALQIKNKYPSIVDGYKKYCYDFDFVEIRRHGIVYWHPIGSQKYVANIFGQESYGHDDKLYTDYLSLENGMKTIRLQAEYRKWSVAIPFKIGCGLGGGDWNFVLKLIETTFSFSPKVNVKIYKYKDGI